MTIEQYIERWSIDNDKNGMAQRNELYLLLTHSYDEGRVRCMTEELCDIVDDMLIDYPKDIFPEPSAGEHGDSVDTCSARAIRWTLEEIKHRILKAAQRIGQVKVGIEAPNLAEILPDEFPFTKEMLKRLKELKGKVPEVSDPEDDNL